MGEQRRRKDLETAPVAPHEHDRNLWVVAVLAFWVSAGITLAVLLITGELRLILVTITLGMLVLGVWLKARYQLKKRKARDRKSGDNTQ